MELFDASKKFNGFDYPKGLKKIAELEIVDLDVWFILDAPFASRYCTDINERYPERKLIPFAKRSDNDDVACFEIGKLQKVEIIHDFANPGWEQKEEYKDFWDWFKSAVNVLIERTEEEA